MPLLNCEEWLQPFHRIEWGHIVSNTADVVTSFIYLFFSCANITEQVA